VHNKTTFSRRSRLLALPGDPQPARPRPPPLSPPLPPAPPPIIPPASDQRVCLAQGACVPARSRAERDLALSPPPSAPFFSFPPPKKPHHHPISLCARPSVPSPLAPSLSPGGQGETRVLVRRGGRACWAETKKKRGQRAARLLFCCRRTPPLPFGRRLNTQRKGKSQKGVRQGRREKEKQRPLTPPNPPPYDHHRRENPPLFFSWPAPPPSPSLPYPSTPPAQHHFTRASSSHTEGPFYDHVLPCLPPNGQRRFPHANHPTANPALMLRPRGPSGTWPPYPLEPPPRPPQKSNNCRVNTSSPLNTQPPPSRSVPAPRAFFFTRAGQKRRAGQREAQKTRAVRGSPWRIIPQKEPLRRRR
jgi:hypothetical protein